MNRDLHRLGTSDILATIGSHIGPRLYESEQHVNSVIAEASAVCTGLRRRFQMAEDFENAQPLAVELDRVALHDLCQ